MRWSRIGLWLALALNVSGIGAARAEEALTPQQKEAVEGIVRDYLLSHPEVIRDALIELQRQQEQPQQASRREAHRRGAGLCRLDPGGFRQGRPEGGNRRDRVLRLPLPLLQGGGARELMRWSRRTRPVRVVLVEFPILGEDSIFASRAAIASRFQGKYMAFHDAMMAHKGNLAQDTVLDLAEDAGIDVEKLKEDMKSPEIDALIDRHYQLADKLGVTGTPAFIIGQELVPGAIDADTMKAKIKQARQS